MNNQFSSTNNDYFLSDPTSVPSSIDPTKETSDEKNARYEKFVKLKKNVRLKLATPKTSQKIQAIGQKYQFELLRLANITRLIREYYFGEVRFEDFAAEIEKRMAVSPFTAQEITRYIKSEIIDWDPWAEYVAKLPKMSAREMFEKKLKIAGTEITAGYVELRGSDDLEDPTIKNWIQDYITHLGYGQHSQMQRTEYLFHSENGRDLSSQDREKLSIILRSFDENIPLPVDEENGEIVFDEQRSMTNDRQRPVIKDQRTMISKSTSTFIPKHQPSPIKQESFIKPYNPISEPPRQAPRPIIAPPAPARTAPTLNFANPIPLPPQQTSAPVQTFPPRQENSPIHLASPARNAAPNAAGRQNGPNPEIEKYFNTPETPEIPPIKIHSMTEHNEPKPARQSLPPRPTIQQPLPPRPPQQPERPKYRVIDPFSGTMPEPKLDGNIVDLSGEK